MRCDCAPRGDFSMSRLGCVLVAGLIAVAGCDVAPAAILGGTFAATGGDTQARYFHKASTLPNGRVMVTGGMRLQVSPPSLISLSSVSFYNPGSGTFSNSFAPIGGGPAVTVSLAVARSSHTQTGLVDGRVLICGGYTNANGTNPGTPTASVEIFDPQTGVMSAGAVMSSARAGHTATRLGDGRVVVAGGATWQIFDPSTNSWSAELALHRARMDHTATLLADGRVLVAGGSGAGPNTIEILDAGTGASFLSGATLAIGVDDLRAATLDDGRVLIVGGQNLATGDTIGDTYLYDVGSDTLTPAPAPPNRAAGLADHEVISFGRYVFVFGGEQQVSNTDTELNYAALFDRASATWTWSSTSMSQAHDDFALTLLQDGRLLLVGGGLSIFGVEFPTAGVDVFTPDVVVAGDLNGDGFVNALDVAPMVTALTKPSAVTARQLAAADVNENGAANGADVQPFVGLVGGP